MSTRAAGPATTAAAPAPATTAAAPAPATTAAAPATTAAAPATTAAAPATTAAAPPSVTTTTTTTPSSTTTTSTTSSVRSTSTTPQPKPASPQPNPPPTTAQPKDTVTAAAPVVTITATPESSGVPPLSSTLTSVFSSESLITEPGGLVVTTTIQSTIVIVPTGSPSSKKSNTGVIVGGVAGGIVALAAAIIIFLLCWRRNRRREEFDGNFDPDRVVRQAGHTDLAGADVTPYHYDPPSSAGPTSGPTSPAFSADGSMRQYRDSQALLGSTYQAAGGATATSGSHYAPTSSDASGPPGSSTHGRSNSYGNAGLGPGFPVAQPYRPLSAKEAEALRQRGESGLGLASAVEESEGDIIQHSDGGRIPEPIEPIAPSRPLQEIPPSYYSIKGEP